MYHQDCISQEYCTNFYENHIEIVIIKMPDNEYNRAQLFFNISIYFTIENTIVKYKNEIFYNEKELKSFFKSFNNHKLSL